MGRCMWLRQNFQSRNPSRKSKIAISKERNDIQPIHRLLTEHHSMRERHEFCERYYQMRGISHNNKENVEKLTEKWSAVAGDN